MDHIYYHWYSIRWLKPPTRSISISCWPWCFGTIRCSEDTPRCQTCDVWSSAVEPTNSNELFLLLGYENTKIQWDLFWGENMWRFQHENMGTLDGFFLSTNALWTWRKNGDNGDTTNKIWEKGYRKGTGRLPPVMLLVYSHPAECRCLWFSAFFEPTFAESFVWGTRVAIKIALSAMKVDIPHWLVVALWRRAWFLLCDFIFHVAFELMVYIMNEYEILIMFSLWNIMSLFHYEWICMIPKLISKKSSNSFCVSTSQKAQQSDSRWCRIWQPNLQSLVSLIRVVLLVGKVVVA